MKVAVCLKRIPAPDGNIRLSADRRRFDFALVDWVLNPPDEHALEAALQLRERIPDTRLLALSVGPRENEAVLRQALAVGADDALLVEAPDADACLAARLAAMALQDFAPDLIVCGRQAVDDQQGYFPAALAEAFGYAHVVGVCAIEVNAVAGQAVLARRAERGMQEARVQLPAVVGCDRMAHELRTPSLQGRLDSKKRPLTTVRPESLIQAGGALFAGAEPRRLGVPPERRSKRVWEFASDQAAVELVRELKAGAYLE